MAEVPERIKQAEDVEMREMRKGKSHGDAEKSEKKFLRSARGKSMFGGFKTLARQVRQERGRR